LSAYLSAGFKPARTLRNRLLFIALLAGFFLCVTVSGTLFAQYHNVLSFQVGEGFFGAGGGRALRQATSTSRDVGMVLGASLVTWLTARFAPSKVALATVPVVAGAMLIPLTTPFGVVASIGLRAFSISLAFEAFEIVAFSRMDARQVVALWGVVDLAAESILRRLPSPDSHWVIPVSVGATLVSVIPILAFAASGERAGVEENVQEDVQQHRTPLTRSMRLDFSASVIGFIAAACFGALVDSNLEAVATNLGQAAATSGELYSSFVAGQLVVNVLFLGVSFLTGSLKNNNPRGFKAKSATSAVMVLGAVFAVFGMGIEFRNLTVTHGTLLLAGMLFAFVFIECKSSLARILFAARLPLRWIASLSAVATGTGIVVRYALYKIPVGPTFWAAGLATVTLVWLHSQVSSGRLLVQLRRRS
jgi:hypothetical protein